MPLLLNVWTRGDEVWGWLEVLLIHQDLTDGIQGLCLKEPTCCTDVRPCPFLK
jgi:hypothetical protein